MLLSRDQKVIEFIETFGAARTEQIERLFFRYDEEGIPLKSSTRVARRRLKRIVEESHIKRDKDPYTGQYVYYYPSRKQLKHKLLRTEIYILLKEGPGRILKFENEYSIENLQADAFCIYQLENKGYLFFIEVQTSNNTGLDIEKYEKLFKSKKYPWEVFPRIIAITDRKQKIDTVLKVVRVNTDFSNWRDIFK